MKTIKIIFALLVLIIMTTSVASAGFFDFLSADAVKQQIRDPTTHESNVDAEPNFFARLFRSNIGQQGGLSGMGDPTSLSGGMDLSSLQDQIINNALGDVLDSWLGSLSGKTRPGGNEDGSGCNDGEHPCGIGGKDCCEDDDDKKKDEFVNFNVVVEAEEYYNMYDITADALDSMTANDLKGVILVQSAMMAQMAHNVEVLNEQVGITNSDIAEN